jgi:hypothetical protein
MEWRARAARQRRTRTLRLVAACGAAAAVAMVTTFLIRAGIAPVRVAVRAPEAISRETPPPSLEELSSEQQGSLPSPADDIPAPAGGERLPDASESGSAAPRADLDVTPRPASPNPDSDQGASRPSTSSPAPSPPPSSGPLLVEDVTYPSADRLGAIRRGDSKDRVFDVFSTVFVKQRGKVTKVEGIRLRASGRSPRDGAIEVGEVVLADQDAAGTLYWFLFEDGRLLAWGRPEEWKATAGRYQIDVNYPYAGRGAASNGDNAD